MEDMPGIVCDNGTGFVKVRQGAGFQVLFYDSGASRQQMSARLFVAGFAVGLFVAIANGLCVPNKSECVSCAPVSYSESEHLASLCVLGAFF